MKPYHMLHIHFVEVFDIDVLVEMMNIDYHRIANENNREDENRYYKHYLIDQHKMNLEHNFQI
jgi:hypothetical protein